MQTRLRRLEETIPNSRPPSELGELARYLFGFELHRLYGIVTRAVERGGGQPASAQDRADYENLLRLASQRQAEGWQLDRLDPRMEELRRIDSTKRRAIWMLILSLRRRHEARFFTELSDTDVFDALDVEPDEIIALAEIVARARVPDDLRAQAEIASRLRLRGKPVSLAEFECLVFRGEIPCEDRRWV